MAETYYSEEHEWITVDGETGTVGITGFAQEQLGDIVFVEVIKENEDVAKDEEVAVVESVKAASDIFSPVSGLIIGANALLEDAPEMINNDPLESGWIFKMTLHNPEELDNLMNLASYKQFLDSIK
ncbi:MAG: glycine cleavage system protein GcvH [Rhodospirillaceae bacterium]|jgi:glycine cleavage system H protein|nr:glycine cleavage system protein GcvH [Rhodospirillaceae bacterium]MDC0999109.1 glycine cleavage system protein GcvH [Alphaproteobacteria bacterium]MBT5913833.1 glycine cleavage system protein GcvH [Rhodospirillaceae bacterium]MBT6307940.1 glycine cleavage system protein GcvH [Rhodospirillaceae bacterium]MBT7730266.1 glycine cleavage system protein GcvH [Rhodospirillaceae bacterium]|tara:strand:+ start:161 stop:538 length:378 start_codon:yes stop_codon:yes gene_type:complete